MHQQKITVRPDSKGRVSLGKFAKGVSSFTVLTDQHHRVILEPNVEIPAREKWLFENKEALEKVKRGLAQAAAGKLTDLGTFAENLNEDDN